VLRSESIGMGKALEQAFTVLVPLIERGFELVIAF
jgi:hypothetical protein